MPTVTDITAFEKRKAAHIARKKPRALPTEHVQTLLVRGDPLKPRDNDLLAQIDTLPVGQPLPDGWQVTDGNMHTSEVIRIGQRYEITGQWLTSEED